MATPQTPYEAVLKAARDVDKLDCALDAEMLGTALLGSVYAIAEEDPAGAVRAFVGGVLNAHPPPPAPAAGTRHPTSRRPPRRRGHARRAGAVLVRPARAGPADRHLCLRRRVRGPDVVPGHL